MDECDLRMMIEQRIARLDHTDPLGWREARMGLLRTTRLKRLAGDLGTDANLLTRKLARLETDTAAELDYLLVDDHLPGLRLRCTGMDREHSILFRLEVIEAPDPDERSVLQASLPHFDRLLLALRGIPTMDAERVRREGIEALDLIAKVPGGTRNQRSLGPDGGGQGNPVISE